MGYYTELKVDVLLQQGTVLETLENLINGELKEELFINKFGEIPGLYSVEDEPELPIEHKFGKSKRWSQIFFNASLHKNNLVINCDIKAYDNIYEDLLDWLKPSIITGIFVKRAEDEEKWTILL